MKIERRTRPSMLSSMCPDVARLQFDSSSEKDSLCGTVMIHDGLNLKCLDQCHSARSHGTNSSQGWRKTVVQSKIDPWVHILALFSPKVISADLPRKAFSQKHAFVDISVFLWLRKQRPSFVQGQPKSYSQLKELHWRIKPHCSNECWLRSGGPSMLSSMCQDVARL